MRPTRWKAKNEGHLTMRTTRAILRRLALAPLLAAAASHFDAQAATFVVTSAADPGDGVCDATCTLREAITAANATQIIDTINFAIQIPVIGEILIQPTSPLPTITRPLIINGYSQGGTSVNTSSTASNAVLRIRIDGAQVNSSTASSLGVCADNTSLRGLSITGFSGVNQRALRFGQDVAGVTCASAPIGGSLRGSFVGLRANGSTAGGNSLLSVNGASVTIGGTVVADRNVIAASATDGLLITGLAASGSQVLNNLFGTDKSGTLDRGNNSSGVTINASAGSVQIGSTTAPNLVAFSGLRGIGASSTSGSGNTWFANHIRDNAFGIDIGNNGITPNDPDDADSGPNDLQNFPIISASSRATGGVNVSATLDIGGSTITPQTFTIAVYASSRCDTSGNGQGERFLGSTTVNLRNLPAFENFSFLLSTSDPLPPGTVITTTATHPNGSSSEFSPCFFLDPPPLVVTSVADTDGSTCGATCSLRQAINAANATPGISRVINFNIPGAGVLMISPTSPLPNITNAVLIDGYSQPGASANTLINGNDAVIRVRLDGVGAGATTNGLGFCSGSQNSTIRGLSITRYRLDAIGFGLQSNGTTCSTTNADGSRVEGNFLGLAPDGSAAGNLGSGLLSTVRVQIGGPLPAQRNIVSANTNLGIFFNGSGASDSVVMGNYIGTDPGGTQNRANLGDGIHLLTGPSSVQIGGEAPNRIAFNRVGILVTGAISRGNLLHANHVFGNTQLGIDLAATGTVPDGVTPNDVDDVDNGPNGLQNFPVLSAAQRIPSGIRVIGQLDLPNLGGTGGLYTIAVYANSSCDPSGFGEGERFLGASQRVLSNVGAVDGSFSFDLATTDPLGPGTQITATASAQSGPTADDGTSEFSACIAVTEPSAALVVTSTADTDGSSCGATCTLRQAINVANLLVGADVISFAIPGNGPFTISPLIDLPVISDPLTIDGYSQLGAAPNTDEFGSNAVIRIRLDGDNAISFGLSVCSHQVTIRGLAITRFGSGMDLSAGDCIVNPTGIALFGNFFGLAVDGVTAAGNAISVDAGNVQAAIGSILLADRNLFASSGNAITIDGANSAGTSIVGNHFGTDATGTLDRGMSSAAIIFNDGVTGVLVGSPIAPNYFRFSETGIVVSADSAGNTLYANEFSDHDSIAINLCPIGVCPTATDPNDPDDADSGGNNLQNFPVLLSALTGPSGLTVSGNLDVPAATNNAGYIIALYESVVCDPTGFGEGEIFLGSQTVQLSGNAESFAFTLPIPPPAAGRIITATATAPSPDRSTSEFSACSVVTAPAAIFSNGFE